MLERFDILINRENVKELDRLAKIDDVSRSHLIRIAIKKYLEEKNGN